MTNNTKKVQKNAKLNVSTEQIEVKKSTKNKAKKLAKQTSGKTWAFAVLFMIIGAFVGMGLFAVICTNDCFKIEGEEEIFLTLDEKYQDSGVKIISFGRDISQNVKIETNLSVDEHGLYYSNEVGTYYIKYTVDDFKYGTLYSIQKIRLITIVETSEGGE